MNRGEIREAVRDILGDQTQGFWTDAELDRYIQLMCDRHAQQALSVPFTENTTSLPGVQEYVVPPYFGEMRRVRWHTETGDIDTLKNAPKTDIIRATQSDFSAVRGDPEVYYYDAYRIGLYPVPNKKPIFALDPPDNECEYWQTVAAERGEVGGLYDTVTKFYSENVYVAAENTCNLFCSHVSLWMRRNARPTPGAIQLFIHPLGKPEYETYYSKYINIADLGIRPEWVHFDFTFHPIELEPNVEGFFMTFASDTDFKNTPRATYADEGPQFAIDRVGGDKRLYFQLHEYRQDIELDFYKNEVTSIETDHEDLEVPDTYHRTIIKMVAARALRKGNRDLQGALLWEAEAEKDIQAARAQAALRTRGRQLRTEGSGMDRYPDATYADGTWRIKSW